MSTIDDVPVSGHERRDVSASAIVKWGAGVIGLVLFTVAAMWIVLLQLQTSEERHSEPASPLASYGPQEPPQPRLQVDPRGEIDQLRSTGARRSAAMVVATRARSTSDRPRHEPARAASWKRRAMALSPCSCCRARARRARRAAATEYPARRRLRPALGGCRSISPSGTSRARDAHDHPRQAVILVPRTTSVDAYRSC
jgi:hypothetical protein